MPTFDTDIFLERYPEFKEVDYEKIDLFLSDAEMEVSQSRWGKLYQRGGGANRNLASESAGELSVSYAMPTLTGTDVDYQLTAYGQEYLRLRKLVGIGVMVA